MKGLGTFIGVITLIILLAALFGLCCIGTFLAPDMWMRLVCFAIILVMVIGITLIAAALGASNLADKK